MLVLGVKTAPQEVRYALLECDGNNIAVFQNSHSENRLKFPRTFNKPEEKLPWLHDEFVRIFRQNNGIEKVAIKTREYKGSQTKVARFSVYMEGIVINLAGQNNIPLGIHTYSSIGTNSQGVENFAQAKINNISNTGWNVQMADAVAVAWLVGSKS